MDISVGRLEELAPSVMDLMVNLRELPEFAIEILHRPECVSK